MFNFVKSFFSGSRPQPQPQPQPKPQEQAQQQQDYEIESNRDIQIQQEEQKQQTMRNLLDTKYEEMQHAQSENPHLTSSLQAYSRFYQQQITDKTTIISNIDRILNAIEQLLNDDTVQPFKKQNLTERKVKLTNKKSSLQAEIDKIQSLQHPPHLEPLDENKDDERNEEASGPAFEEEIDVSITDEEQMNPDQNQDQSLPVEDNVPEVPDNLDQGLDDNVVDVIPDQDQSLPVEDNVVDVIPDQDQGLPVEDNVVDANPDNLDQNQDQRLHDNVSNKFPDEFPDDLKGKEKEENEKGILEK